ncbi:uncharacterized protein ACBR49_020465 [Aulostomus maculatus]
MSSIQHLRRFVNERLTAAAEEIFGFFEKAVMEYEEEIDRQRRVLEIVWKPHIKLQRIDVQQQHVHMEEEGNSSLEQEEPEPLQLKEEPEPLQLKEERRHIQEGEQLEVKQEIEDFTFIPLGEESHIMKDEVLHLSPSETQSPEENQPMLNMLTQNFMLQKLNIDNQLLFNNSTADDSRDDKGATFCDCESDGNAETMQRLDESNRRDNNVLSSTMLKMNDQVNDNTHRIKKFLKCETGEKRFYQTSVVEAQERTHPAETPYYCITCGKYFRSKKGLVIHRRAHTGEKLYPCNTCEKRFTDMSKMKRHLMSHTGIKPYTCKICGKDFRDSSAMKIHMRSHTGERPYLCNSCGKRFTQLTHLKKHLKSHIRRKLVIARQVGTRLDFVEIESA